MEFVKRLEQNEIGMNLYRPNKSLDLRKPKLPEYEYFMNDIGPNSNDSVSKAFAAQFHGVTQDIPDQREWIKPYIPQVAEKMMNAEVVEEQQLQRDIEKEYEEN